MKSAVIVFPASNCDRDAETALRDITGRAPHMVWHAEGSFPEVDLILLPGGFSYGDYLRAGAIAAHSPVLKSLKEKADKGVPVMGVCNGFQVLTETGLLPGVLMRNAGLKFICRNVGLKVETSQSLFTGGYEDGQVLSIPVAHHDGNYFADEKTLDEIEQNGQVAFRYVDENGEMNAAGNPNGSARNIAGVFNKAKTVIGFMPHPENAIDSAVGGTDGRGLFDGLVRALS